MPVSCFRAQLLALLVILTFLPSEAQNNQLEFTHLTVDEGLPQNTIHGIMMDKYGFMWFGTWGGLCRYDGYSFRVFRNDPSDTTSLAHNRVHFIVKDSAQDLWIQTYDSSYICKYNYSAENFTRIPVRKVKHWIRDSLNRRNNYSRRHAITSDYIWLTEVNRNLLVQKNRHTGQFITYSAGSSISDELITDLYLDDRQNLWVGTFNGGINRSGIHLQPYLHYSRTGDKSTSLIDNHIRAICVDNDNNLWVGTRNQGVTMLNRTAGVCKHYVKGQNGNNSLQDNYIRKIVCDKYGLVWIGTKNGLDLLVPRSGRFKHFEVRGPNYIPNNWVYDILEDSYGNLLIGTFNGIAKYNRTTGFFKIFPANMFSRPTVRVLFEDRHHLLWVGTEGDGVYVFRRMNPTESEEQLSPLLHLKSLTEKRSLSSNMIYTITEDNLGFIWIGTSNGVNRYDPLKKEVKCFSSENNLPDDMVVGALADPSGFVWISHSNGLSRINTQTLEVRNFNKNDGLQANEFSEGAYYRNSHTGELFFGGINGINAFFPSEIKSNHQYPSIFFTNFYVDNHAVRVGEKVNGKVLLERSILETQTLKINYATRNFSIEFAALQFANPLQTFYKYKLEGFNKDWIKIKPNQRRAYYTNLRPGTYVFKVLAANSDGVWTPQPHTLTIIILPPWYRTWWAYILYLAIFALLLYYIYRQIIFRENVNNQIKFEKMKAEKMEELDRLKVQFFTGVSHEFRTPLSLIVDPLERIVNDNLPPEKVKSYALLMQRNTQRLMNLVNQLLDFRKLEAGHLKLEVKDADIFSFISRIAEAFEHQARQHRIQLSVYGTSVLVRFDPDKMEKVIYNLLSNAFKNTPDEGSISIEIKKTGSLAEVVVSDTGVGIPAEQLSSIFEMFYQAGTSNRRVYAGTGIGLALTKQLIELHGGSISAQSTEGQGSQFTILLPACSAEATHEELADITSRKEITQEINSEEKEKRQECEQKNELLPLLLVVEDNSDVCEYICMQLRSDYRVVAAANGLEGLTVANAEIPDLIISDVMMPDMDGFELCEAIKTQEITSHIPVILLTARQSTESKVKGYEIGADAYLTKPFSSPMLLARVQNLLTSREKLRQHFSGQKLTDPSILGMNAIDRGFVDKAIAIVHENIDNSQFDIDTLAEKLLMSRSQLYRKIKALSNQSVNEFINTIRMNRAAELLLAGQHSISEVAYETGFTQPNNFTRSFTKHTGVSPSEFIKKKKSS
jgi:signal transduction histidine kinase/ligand-binding sensor domain-containing protein/DNA-binding response OmpR family regulator